MFGIAHLPTGIRLLRLLAAGTFFYWLVMTILMHIPLPPPRVHPQPVLPTDKTAHLVLYAGLATALFVTLEQRARLRPATRPRTRLARATMLLGVCTLHGYVEEFTQPLSGRTYDLADLAADCVGAAIALAACLLIFRFLPASTK